MEDRLMKKRFFFVVVSFMLLFGIAKSVFATTLQQKSFEDLVVEADMIAIGQVSKVESHPTGDLRYVYTYATLGQLELLKGIYRDPEITLRMDGGMLDDTTFLVIPGIPEFYEGEKVVIFVRGNGESICPLVGWEQGMLRVARDEKTGQEMLLTSQGMRIQKIERENFIIAHPSDNDNMEIFAGNPDDGGVGALEFAFTMVHESGFLFSPEPISRTTSP
jgi:hypothetical protein